MPGRQEIHIAINPKTGQMEIEINGVTGTGCTDITDLLSKGHQVQDSRLTEEYYVPSEEPAYIGE